MDQNHIDALLERYLSLVNEYAQLRERLSKLQAGVFQNIARANFAAERGLRYGQDQYDDRMQALRTLEIRFNDDGGDGAGAPIFTVVDEGARREAKVAEEAGSAESVGDNDLPSRDEGEGEGEDKPDDTQRPEDKGKEEEPTEKPKAVAVDTKNPLRWFGVLVPPPLRSAQSLSVEAIEQVVPRLVSVSAEMQRVEIEVRRARKKRAKAEAALNKGGKASEAAVLVS